MKAAALLPILALLTLPFSTILQTCDSDNDGDGWTTGDGDCNDVDPSIHPGATEVCDGVDNDCNDLTDEEDSGLDLDTLSLFYPDVDLDTYGEIQGEVNACSAPDGYVSSSDDCDDGDAAINPAAEEVCDEVDNNCDGQIDEGVQITYYFDGDGDTYGLSFNTYTGCSALVDYVVLDGDCDDADATSYPGADEYCDAVDHDCDGTAEDSDSVDASKWYPDVDQDGYGTPDSFETSCSPLQGYTSNALDCNDSMVSVNPDAIEICYDGFDNDCDGTNNGCLFQGTINTSEAMAAVYGSRLEDTAGYSVTGVGDMNGDGYDDVVVGAPGVDGRFYGLTGSRYGAAFLVLGPPGVTQSIDSADAVFVGEDAGHLAGVSVAAGGDINGDGTPDLLIGAPGNSDSGDQAGAVYVLYGPLTGTVSLGKADAILYGEAAGDSAGTSVAGLGDINGDGYDDILIGAPGNDSVEVGGGAAYVMYGPLSGAYDLFSADAYFYGDHLGAGVGLAVSSAGDFNQDGVGDLLIGGPDTYGATQEMGAAYIILDPSTASPYLSAADVILTGAGGVDQAGWSVASAGDVNNDGYGDVMIGAPGINTAYVVYGPKLGTVSLVDSEATLVGTAIGTGWSVSSAGDVDGDGALDFLVGAPLGESSGEETGKAYLFLGPAQGSVDLSIAGLRLNGSRGDAAGYALAAAGDLNGDGVSDILVGAPGNDLGGDSGGAAYAIYGPLSQTQTLAESDSRLYGSGGGTYEIGISIASAGDVNGDGELDIIIGAPNDDGAGTKAGAGYVVYGPLTGSIDYAEADVRIVGEAPYQSAGRSVAGVGDVNQDGYDDLLVGAPLYYGSSGSVTGAAYLVLGPPTRFEYLYNADAIFIGEGDADLAGQTIAAAGDLNADGYPDLLIGAPYHDELSENVGAVYVIYGPIEGQVSLADADARIVGVLAQDLVGQSIGGRGDINNDGYGDFVIGAANGAGSSGAVYVFYGPVSGSLTVSDADARLLGETEGDFAGRAVAIGGDFDADGYGDILVGATADNTGGGGAGAIYVVRGPVTGEVSLASAVAKFGGENQDDLAGRSVSAAGDVNGDGYDDLLVGAPGEDSNGNEAGAAYLIYGPFQGPESVAVSSVKILGEAATDLAGWTAVSAGDMDGDGLPDILVGAKGNDNGGSDAGAVYVISTDAR